MRHRIALIPGDGIGKEVVPAAARVLDVAGKRFGFDFEWTTFDLGYPSTVAAVWFVIVLATVLTLTWAFRQREKLEY